MILPDLPIRTQSEGNLREHWGAKHKRHTAQRRELFRALEGVARPRLPATITLTRIAPRKLDRDDNLTNAFKSIKDIIAWWLCMERRDYPLTILWAGVRHKIGQYDGDPRLTWLYAQERGAPKYYAVRIEIEEDGNG